MTFLPIVERELRVAARRKSTYRIRSWTAVLAIVACSCSLLFVWAAAGRGNLGKPLFALLTHCAFGLCLLAGVLLTADSLSEEKREGTLGLLFLTDLKGYDVVLGKFFARSLNAFYGLLALLPVTAIPVLLGGVTGGEFGRMALALGNALFFSLASGIWVSASANDSQRAMGGTLGWLLFLVLGLPALARLGAFFHAWPGWLDAAWLSPLYPFVYALEPAYLGGRNEFWGALLVSGSFAGLLLALASRALPRQWQQRVPAARGENTLSRWWRGGRGNPVKRARQRAQLLAINPVLWLVGEQPRKLSGLVWLIVGGWGVVVVAAGAAAPREITWAYYGAKFCAFLLKMLIATEVCRFFAEGRRSGALEVLLCTPLRSAEILRGQWLAVRRIFLVPLIVFLMLTFSPIGFLFASLISAPGLPRTGDALAGVLVGLGAFLWFTLTLAADILAVCWFGAWLSLSLKKPSLAPALTILFVLILPSFLCFLGVVADIFFIAWGAARLHQDFRWLLTQQFVGRAESAR